MTKRNPVVRDIQAKLKELREELVTAYKMVGVDVPEDMIKLELLAALRRVAPTYLTMEIGRAWKVEDEVPAASDDGDDE